MRIHYVVFRGTAWELRQAKPTIRKLTRGAAGKQGAKEARRQEAAPQVRRSAEASGRHGASSVVAPCNGSVEPAWVRVVGPRDSVRVVPAWGPCRRTSVQRRRRPGMGPRTGMGPRRRCLPPAVGRPV